MDNRPVMVITGTRKGIGKCLAMHYAQHGFRVFGCSREPTDYVLDDYEHFCLDVCDEAKVKQMLWKINKECKRIDVLINNAGIASMNHVLLTPMRTVEDIFKTNVMGTFLFCREAAKIMQQASYGRIVNFATVATPLKLEGEAIYASSKAAVVSLTEILARELGQFGITVNAVGPTPVRTDLIRSVPAAKIEALVSRQAIRRLGEFKDILNVVDFLIRPESEFVSGQIIYLGGI